MYTTKALRLINPNQEHIVFDDEKTQPYATPFFSAEDDIQFAKQQEVLGEVRELDSCDYELQESAFAESSYNCAVMTTTDLATVAEDYLLQGDWNAYQELRLKLQAIANLALSSLDTLASKEPS